MDWREKGSVDFSFMGFAGSGFLSEAATEGCLADESGWFAIKGTKGNTLTSCNSALPAPSECDKMHLIGLTQIRTGIIAQGKKAPLQPLSIESCGPGSFGRGSITQTAADVLNFEDRAKRGLGRGCA
jgi:hypothetical protein